jgi:hypothetical protein
MYVKVIILTLVFPLLPKNHNVTEHLTKTTFLEMSSVMVHCFKQCVKKIILSLSTSLVSAVMLVINFFLKPEKMMPDSAAYTYYATPLPLLLSSASLVLSYSCPQLVLSSATLVLS